MAGDVVRLLGEIFRFTSAAPRTYFNGDLALFKALGHLLLAAERECREAQIETNGSRERIAEAMRLEGVDISLDDDVAAIGPIFVGGKCRRHVVRHD